ncbi:MAG TPA: DUF488 domain-containing protein [Acidimicrobiales bacterium]
MTTDLCLATVGHGTADAAPFADLLRGAGIALVADVRRYPGSRRHPHFGREVMGEWLPGAGIAYRWFPSLGGRRRGRPGSPNLGLRNEQFRAYADHMATDEFTRGVEELLAAAREVERGAAATREVETRGGAAGGAATGAPGASVAVLCAETVWWRCHRWLLADHLVLVEGVEVRHLRHDGGWDPHPVTPEARRADGHVVYDRV